MAEQDRTTEQIRAGMVRWSASTQDQIDDWALERTALIDRAQQLWGRGEGEPLMTQAVQALIDLRETRTEWSVILDRPESLDRGAALDAGNATLRAQIEAYRAGHALEHDTPSQGYDHGMSY